MPEIKIEMTERDFERLNNNSTYWAQYWASSWEEQVNEGRFEHAEKEYGALPRADWKMLYSMDEGWINVMMACAFLKAEGYTYELLFDIVDPGQYVILTNYQTKSWIDLEIREQQAEKETGLLRGHLVESDQFKGTAEMIGFSFAEPQLMVSVRVPGAEPPIQSFPATALRPAKA